MNKINAAVFMATVVTSTAALAVKHDRFIALVAGHTSNVVMHAGLACSTGWIADASAIAPDGFVCYGKVTIPRGVKVGIKSCSGDMLAGDHSDYCPTMTRDGNEVSSECGLFLDSGGQRIRNLPCSRRAGAIPVETSPSHDGGSLVMESAMKPAPVQWVGPPPKWGVEFRLGGKGSIIRLEPSGDSYVFDQLVERDPKRRMLQQWAVWWNQITQQEEPRAGAYARLSSGAGAPASTTTAAGHPGNLEWRAAGFTITVQGDGMVIVKSHDLEERVPRSAVCASVFYEKFAHWLSLATATPQLYKVPSTDVNKCDYVTIVSGAGGVN